MLKRSARAGLAVVVLATAALAAFPTTGGAQTAPPDPSRRPAVALPADQPDPTQFILSFRSGTRATSSDADAQRVAAAAATSVGARSTIVRRLASGAALVRLSRAVNAADASKFLDAVSSDPSIAYVEPDLMLQATAVPNDPSWSQQWQYHEAVGGIHLAEAHDVADGTGTVVAVIDTGRTAHPDLDANMLDGYDFISSATSARDGDGRDANESDEGDWQTAAQCGGTGARNSSWHGTHVSGTIAAVTNNGIGVAGVAPGAKILPVRVLGLCGGSTADIADAIAWASGASVAGVPANTTPADVINMSLGGSGACGAASAFQVAINTAVGNGTTVVVAAGNSASNASGFTPASCTNAITVAATGRTGSRAPYSNFGAVVDLAAPGGDTSGGTANGILSTLNAGTTVVGSPSYAFYQGTSMATPHVAGVAALVLSQQSLTPAAVETLLESTSRAFPGTCGQCGAGLLDAQAAVSGGGGVTGTIGFAVTKTKVTEQPTFVDVQLTVNRSGGTGTATVSWATGGGSATPGSDYNVAGGTLTFAPGASSQTVTVRVLGDGLTELTEKLNVSLSNGTTGITVSPAKSTISIKANST